MSFCIAGRSRLASIVNQKLAAFYQAVSGCVPAEALDGSEDVMRRFCPSKTAWD